PLGRSDGKPRPCRTSGRPRPARPTAAHPARNETARVCRRAAKASERSWAGLVWPGSGWLCHTHAHASNPFPPPTLYGRWHFPDRASPTAETLPQVVIEIFIQDIQSSSEWLSICGQYDSRASRARPAASAIASRLTDPPQESVMDSQLIPFATC